MCWIANILIFFNEFLFKVSHLSLLVRMLRTHMTCKNLFRGEATTTKCAYKRFFASVHHHVSRNITSPGEALSADITFVGLEARMGQLVAD